MPNRDRTGPNAEGPMTGRRMGECMAEGDTQSTLPPAYGDGRRGGRGPGRGRGRRFFGRAPRRLR